LLANFSQQAFDLEANQAPHYNTRLDRIEEMLGQLLATRSHTTVETSTTDTRHSMGTLTNDSPLVQEKAKLLPTTTDSYPHDPAYNNRDAYANRDAGYISRDTAYDHHDSTGPVALATPVDLHGLAGHISEEHIRRQ
jgi:predicted secreted protein